MVEFWIEMSESDLSVFVEEGVSQEDKAALLIEVIQQYEFLYNLKHKDYKNNRKKEESWHEIAILLNSTGKELKYIFLYVYHTLYVINLIYLCVYTLILKALFLFF